MISNEKMKAAVLQAASKEEAAELVLKECMEVLQLKRGKMTGNYPWENVGRIMSAKIAMHFGVSDETNT